MRFIKGRSNLSCTIFVPWDCNNHCKFCTSKHMYKERTCDMDAIIAQIKKINQNPLITEFVLTGGEPLADIEKCQILLDAMEKPCFVNTTFPLEGDVQKRIDFVNNSKIARINISRHMHQKFYEPILPMEDFKKITKSIKLNVVLSETFDVDVFDAFIQPLKGMKNLDICIRADYRNITKDNLKNRDEVFEKLIMKYDYTVSGGCMVCNDDQFYNDDFKISYHRGMEHSLVKYGNRRYVNDILITIDGMIYDDWDFIQDNEFERWVFGEFTLDDDVSEYVNDVEFIKWLLEKNGEKLEDHIEG